MTASSIQKPFELGHADISSTVALRIEALPPEARTIIEEIERDHRQAEGLRLAVFADMERERERRDSLLGELAHYDRQIRHGAVQSEADAKRRARIVADIERSKVRSEKLRDEQRKSSQAGPSLETIHDWLHGQPHKFRMRDVKIELRKNQTAAQALIENRDSRGDFTKLRRSVLAAKVPLAAARAKAIFDIDTLAERGRPDVRLCFHLVKDAAGKRNQGDVQFPTQAVRSFDGAGVGKVIDGGALVAFLFRDQLISAIDGLLAEHASDDALTKEERERKLVEIDATLAQLEFKEAALVRMARAEGAKAHYRGDTNIAALLGIEIAPDEEADFG